MTTRKLTIVLLCLAALLAAPAAARGQSGGANRLVIVDADAADLPALSVTLGLFDERGQPQGDVRPEEVALSIDGRPITATLELAPAPRELAVVVVADFSAAMADEPRPGGARVDAMVEQIKRMLELLEPEKTPVSLVTFADTAQVAFDWSREGAELRATLDALRSRPLPAPNPEAPYALADAVRLGLAQFAKTAPQLDLAGRPRALFVYAAGAPGRALDGVALRGEIDALGLASNPPATTLVAMAGGTPGEFNAQPGNPESLAQLAAGLPNARALPYFALDPNELILQRNTLDGHYMQVVGAQQLFRLAPRADTLDAATLAALAVGRHRIEVTARGASASVVVAFPVVPPTARLELPAQVLQNRVPIGVEVLYAQRPVRQVEYFLDDRSLGVALAGPAFVHEVDVNSLAANGWPPGTPLDAGRPYHLAAVVTDVEGLTRHVDGGTVTLVPPAPEARPIPLLLVAALLALLGVAAGLALSLWRRQPPARPVVSLAAPSVFDGLSDKTVVALPRSAAPAAGGSEPRVSVVEGAAPRTYQLATGRQCIVGREVPHGIAVEHHQVSRNHARVALVPGGMEIVDLGSANGTFVGEGRRRLKPHQAELLRSGEPFWVGPEVKLVFEQ